MSESMRSESIGLAAFTLVTHLIEQLVRDGVMTEAQKQQVFADSARAARAKGGEINIDAAALIGLLR